MNVLIVEDNELQLKALTAIITDNFPDFNCYQALTYNTALEIISSHSIQLFLLDIDLGNNSSGDGILIGEKIRAYSAHLTTPILYITAVPDKVFSAIHHTNCFDYILKPFTPDDLIFSINKLISGNIIKNPPLEFRDISGVYIRIEHDHIKYIHSKKHHIFIFTNEGKYETGNFTMLEIIKILPDNFLRCHKSYIVNTDILVSFDKSTMILQTSDATIPVGRNYKKEVERVFL